MHKGMKFEKLLSCNIWISEEEQYDQVVASGSMDLHIGPQPAVSTSVGNSVDIVPLEREVNLNVNKSVELLGNILDDLLEDFDSIKPND